MIFILKTLIKDPSKFLRESKAIYFMLTPIPMSQRVKIVFLNTIHLQKDNQSLKIKSLQI